MFVPCTSTILELLSCSSNQAGQLLPNELISICTPWLPITQDQSCVWGGGCGEVGVGRWVWGGGCGRWVWGGGFGEVGVGRWAWGGGCRDVGVGVGRWVWVWIWGCGFGKVLVVWGGGCGYGDVGVGVGMGRWVWIGECMERVKIEGATIKGV